MIFILFILSSLRFLNLMHYYQSNNYELGLYVKNMHKQLFNFKLNFWDKKVKLKFTKRVKRHVFLFALLSLVSFLHIVIVISFFFFMPVIFYITALIITPVEKNINKRFMRKASLKLSHSNIEKIAITGSYGKTSTKNFLSEILCSKYNTIHSPKSYNTPMGLSKFINNSQLSGVKYLIAEMGATKCGDIRELCDFINPNIGVITEVGKQHLDTFGNLEGVCRTKFELANHGSVQKLFLNFDNPLIEEYSKSLSKEVISFGSQARFDYYYQKLVENNEGLTFDVYYKYRFLLKVKVGILGKHNALNILGSIAVAHNLGLKVSEIKDGISRIKSIEHRLELKKYQDNYIIDDAFNSNEVGFINALDTLDAFDRMKIIITPGLVEISNDLDFIYKKVGKKISDVCDLCILIGENGSKLETYINGIRVIKFDSFKDGFDYYKSIITKNVLLIENDLPDKYQ